MTVPVNHQEMFTTHLAELAREYKLIGPQIRIITKAYKKLDDTGLLHVWGAEFDLGAWMLAQLPGQTQWEAPDAPLKDFSQETHGGPPEPNDGPHEETGHEWTYHEAGDIHYILDAYEEDTRRKLVGHEVRWLRMQYEALPTASKRELWGDEAEDTDDVNERFFAWIGKTLAIPHQPMNIPHREPQEGGDYPIEAQRHTKHAQGCFQAAGDDEPVFTLRAKDAFAPAVVAFWIQLVEASVRIEDMDGDQARHLMEKIADARHCIGAMVEWQRNNTHKIPD